MINGIKKVIANHKTKVSGEECYGLITDIYPDGNYVVGKAEYRAEIEVYIKEKNSIETILEVIGFNPNKYQINTFVYGKYYEGDFNIIEKVDSYQKLPPNIQQIFQQNRKEKE